MLNIPMYLTEQTAWITERRFAFHQVLVNLHFSLRKGLRKESTISFVLLRQDNSVIFLGVGRAASAHSSLSVLKLIFQGARCHVGKEMKFLLLTQIPAVMGRETSQPINKLLCSFRQVGRCQMTGGTASSPRGPCGWWGSRCTTKASTSAMPSVPSGWGPSPCSSPWPPEVSCRELEVVRINLANLNSLSECFGR